MIENLPFYIVLVFNLTTVLTLWFLYKASKNSGTVLAVALGWLILQGLITMSGFYTDVNTLPPKFVLLILPPFIFILYLFLSQKGKTFVDQMDMEWMAWLHTVRLPVEIVLLWLFLNKQIPQVMTFEGRNFDIFSGVTAAFIAYFGIRQKKFSRGVLIAWNFICLALVLNVVIHGILSVPFRFQQMSFDQPNVGILYFPFSWLPGFIVPVVIFCHLASLRRLINQR